jgi:TetR/AcrR family transcriptional regulator, mexJK operon transcriptional repressor
MSDRRTNKRCAARNTRQDILEAALRLFLERGYGAAGMDAIAKEAGVSKQTVYSHFGAKSSLFDAIIRLKCSQLLEPLLDEKVRAAGPEKALCGIAERFSNLILAPEAAGFMRVIIAESGRFPELAQAFFDDGPDFAANSLADYLAEQNEQGVLEVSDPSLAARIFFGMLRGDFQMRLLLGIKVGCTAKDKERLAKRAVKDFLAAYAKRS